MHHPAVRTCAWAALLIGLFFLSLFVSAQDAPAPQALLIAHEENQGDDRRQISIPLGEADGGGPRISNIDSPTPSCYQPDVGSNVCYINWYYLSVNAAPATSMLTMTVTLNAVGPIAHHQGFFQSSFFVPGQMFGQGFRVECGPTGAGGNPTLGNAYGYSIRARDSNGQIAGNFGTIFCPPFVP